MSDRSRQTGASRRRLLTADSSLAVRSSVSLGPVVQQAQAQIPALNADEEPEQRTYPRDPEFRKRFGPRGVIKASADGRIEDTGPLTKKRMETIDDETSAAAMDFMNRQVKANRPFFCWFNSTRMHFRTHVREAHRGPAGLTARTE
jgi:arylsulfatase